MKLLHITTVPETLKFLTGQIGWMRSRGMDVRAVSSSGKLLEEFGRAEGIMTHAVEMPRSITPLRDLITVGRLWLYMRRMRPDIVHAHTPKGGLLGMIAAWLARVPIRIYHIHGLPLMTAKSSKYRLLWWSERVACTLARQVLCVSHSIRDVAIEGKLCHASKIKVLCEGSINGIEADKRFNPQSCSSELRASVRKQHGIPAAAVVLGFVGRIVRDKGLVELVQAWERMRELYPNVHLLAVGPFEAQDPLPPSVEHRLRNDSRIHLVGLEWNTPPLYIAMDLVVLPTYREGLPYVPLEAAAMELPVVATSVPGCTDAVADGVTGTLVPARDSAALLDAIRRYLDDPFLRLQHGCAGRERVQRDFRPERIWQATFEEYVRLLQEQGLLLPQPKSSTSDVEKQRKAA